MLDKVPHAQDIRNKGRCQAEMYQGMTGKTEARAHGVSQAMVLQISMRLYAFFNFKHGYLSEGCISYANISYMDISVVNILDN